MSADNGIYVAKFPNGEFRVGHGFASNIIEMEEDLLTGYWRNKEMDIIWGESPVFTNQGEAIDHAFKVEQEYGWTEYGVCIVRMPFNFGENK